MTDDASPKAAGEAAGEAAVGPLAPARTEPAFTIRSVPPPTAEERRARRAGFKTDPTGINFDLSELTGPLFFKSN